MRAIGLDPGKETGLGVWNAETKILERCASLAIHRAMDEVRLLADTDPALVVIFEDARLRTWYGDADARQARSGAAIREGVGSVKRDCSIWEDFLEDRRIPYVGRKPTSGGTKWPALQFAAATGWKDRTNEHARDAGMLVYGLPPSHLDSIRLAWERERAPRAKASART